mgnify:CR=1 FL=1
MKRRFRLLVLAAAAAGLHACSGEAKRERAAVADSAVSRDVLLRAFQSQSTRVDTLSNAVDSRDQLVQEFIVALEKRDTATLRRLAINRAEFAYLYYPTTPQSLPPYELEPGLLWELLQHNSERGIRKALTTSGGEPFGFMSYQCDSLPSHEGLNYVWGPCTVLRRTERGDTSHIRMFTQVIERDGRWKFLNYSNRID